MRGHLLQGFATRVESDERLQNQLGQGYGFLVAQMVKNYQCGETQV